MMFRTPLLVAVTLCLLVSLLRSSAQQPAEHFPTRLLHGWSATGYAASRNPANPQFHYILDNQRAVVALGPRDGQVVRSATFYGSGGRYLRSIAVDSRNYVYVEADNAKEGHTLKVFDEQLRSLKNVSLDELRPPPPRTENLQIVVDSTNAVYLFSSTATPSSANGRVWVLSPREWQQQASWQAPITLSGNEYLAAIDSNDYLYFQEVRGSKMLYIADQQGGLQYTYQLGSGNASEPVINALAIDAQLQMWHTHLGHVDLTVLDSTGRLVASFDVLSKSRYSYTQHIGVDLLGNVNVWDGVEQALLVVSPRGDIINTLSSNVPNLWSVTELLADHSSGGGGGGRRGRDGGSLMFGDWNSPYVVQRMSIDESDAGALLQRYVLPPRLQEDCFDDGVDIGSRTGNIYVLLGCLDWDEFRNYALLYVTTQAGRVVSEFRVPNGAYRVRADEDAGLVYISSRFGFNPRDFSNAVLAYSTSEGRQVANYTTADPVLNVISDITVLPRGPQLSPLLVVVDYGNHRIVHFDTANGSVASVQTLPDNVYCKDVTYSLGRRSAAYYVSCRSNEFVNKTYVERTFVHKWNVETPGQPLLTDAYVPPAGAEADFASIVVGLDSHLYAYDTYSGSVWQWREADRVQAAGGAEEPRVHVAEMWKAADQAGAEVVEASRAERPQVEARMSFERLRGMRSN